MKKLTQYFIVCRVVGLYGLCLPECVHFRVTETIHHRFLNVLINATAQIPAVTTAPVLYHTSQKSLYCTRLTPYPEKFNSVIVHFVGSMPKHADDPFDSGKKNYCLQKRSAVFGL